MNYELAKKLKDAGYPQKRECDNHFCKHEIGKNICSRCETVDFCAYPTLEELIEACGKTKEIYDSPFEFGLQFMGDKWVAGYSDSNYHENWGDLAFGETAIEAVANLWLLLNAKD